MKKRYMVTVDEEAASRCKAAIAHMKLHPGYFSQMISDYLELMAPLLERTAQATKEGRKEDLRSVVLRAFDQGELFNQE